jgi:hypothetical protein
LDELRKALILYWYVYLQAILCPYSIVFVFCRYNDSDTLLPRLATVSSMPALPPISPAIDPSLLDPAVFRNTAHSSSTTNTIIDPAQAPKAYQGVAMEQAAAGPFTEKEIEMVANIPDCELVSTGDEERDSAILGFVPDGLDGDEDVDKDDDDDEQGVFLCRGCIIYF